MVAGVVIGIVGLILRGNTYPGTNGECLTIVIMLFGGVLFVVGAAIAVIASLQ